MSVIGSQQQTFLRLLRALQPHWARDFALPARIEALLARHKEFGSRDRRLYRELIYTTLRYLPWIEPLLAAQTDRAVKLVAWLAAETRDTMRFRSETAGDWPTLGTLAERAAFAGADPTVLLPAWFQAECDAVFAPPELDVQLRRPPVWLRLQTPDSSVVAREFEARGWSWAPSPVLPQAWRLLAEADVTKSDSFQSGLFEVQDLGSQLLLETVAVAPGGAWLDACAGAGGKTLQLAARVGSSGSVDAFDVRPAAIDELRSRVARARFANVRTITPAASARYDGVLIDAPCSGSGTWRRAPHLKWVTTPAVLAQRAKIQTELLSRYAGNVRPGGVLVYATCSLARTENDSVVAAFLADHAEFTLELPPRTFGLTSTPSGLTLLPSRYDTDGFFVSTLRRN